MQVPGGGQSEVSGDKEEDRELGLLAVAHAAFDPIRVIRRRTVLLDSVLRALFDVDRASCPTIVARLQTMFGSNSITSTSVQRALSDAQAAGLVERRETLLIDQPDWSLCDDARRDLIIDIDWAKGAVERFDRAVRARLDDDPNRPLIKPERDSQLARSLRSALAMGAQGLYGVAPTIGQNGYRPAQFNDRAALAAVEKLEPRAARRAIRTLVLAAIDPSDEFGEEFISMLAATNVLYGLVTGRDLPNPPSLSGTRVLIDTSVLLAMVDQGSTGDQAVRETIRISRELGCEIIVAAHSLQEWERLFDGADEEVGNARGSLGSGIALIQNPFLRAFLRAEETNPDLSWAKFRAMWRDPTSRLRSLGITVREANNHTDADVAFVSKMTTALTAENRTRADDTLGTRRTKKKAALDADAQSAAMIARWRNRSGSATAFFVATDRMTGACYKKVKPDDKIPLTVTLPAWSVLVGGLVGDGASSQPDLARLIANASIADSFYSIAASFSVEEASAFAAALTDEPPGIGDVQEFVQATLDDFEAESREDRLALVRQRGAAVRDSRATRKDQRARRAQVQLADREAEAEERGRAIASEAAEKERASLVESFTRELTSKDTEFQRRIDFEREQGHAAEERIACLWKRRLEAVVAASVTIAGATAGISLTEGWTRVVVVCLGVICLLGATKYGIDPKATRWGLIGTLLFTIAVAILGVAGDRLSPSKEPPSGPTTTTVP